MDLAQGEATGGGWAADLLGERAVGEEPTYGTMGGTMRKTTLYLPDDLKSAVERAATEEQRSEAEIIREAIRAAVENRRRPRPRVPLTNHGLGDPRASERCDDLLSGFGER